MRGARALGILAATAAAVLGSTLAAGAAMTSASPAGAPVSGASGWTCSYTNPEYMIHSGGATLSVQPGTAGFAVTSAPSGAWADPYITAGYDVGLNSELCNSRVLPNSGGAHGWSYAVPVRLGRTGAIAASVHDVTAAGFRGNTGFDIWFEPSPGINTYTAMANQGAASTEIMIWLSHPGLGAQSSNLRYYPVSIDGHRWQVTVGLAAKGHGKNATRRNGWNVVNFIAPQIAEGNVTIANLFLNPFFSYAIARHWLLAHDYLMAIDQGAEFTHGTMRVAGYALSGVR
jgi:Glycosyl hydrolase family 12